MSYPVNSTIKLEEKLNVDDVKILRGIRTEEVDLKNRIEFNQLETNRKLTMLNMERIQKGVFPSVSFSGSLGAGHSNTVFNPFQRWFDHLPSH